MSEQTTSIVLRGHSKAVNSAVHSPDGRWTASASDDETVIVRKSGSDQVVCTLKHSGTVESLAFSADSKRLLSSSRDRTACVWDVASGKCLSELEHPSFMYSVAWSPDDTFFLTGGSDEKVRKWDAATYECLHTLDGHTDYVRSLAISPDCSFFVSGGDDNIAIVWEVRAGETPREARRLEGHTGYVYGLAISPDNSRIATASKDKTVKMWSVAGIELWSMGVGECAYSVAFSTGGRFLSVGIGDSFETKPAPVLILDAGTGAEVARLDGHGHTTRSVSYHPLGHTLLSGSYDNTCREWTLPASLVDPPAGALPARNAASRAAPKKGFFGSLFGKKEADESPAPAPSLPQPRTSGHADPKPPQDHTASDSLLREIYISEGKLREAERKLTVLSQEKQEISQLLQQYQSALADRKLSFERTVAELKLKLENKDGTFGLLEEALGRLQAATPETPLAPMETAVQAAQSLDYSVSQEVSELLELPLTLDTLPKLRDAGLDGLEGRVATAQSVVAAVSAQLAEFCQGDVPPLRKPIAAAELLRNLQSVRDKDPLESVRTKVKDLVSEIADLVNAAVNNVSELDKVRALVAQVVELTSDQSLGRTCGHSATSDLEAQCSNWLGAENARVNAALATLSPQSISALKERVSTLERVQGQWDELSGLLEENGDIEFEKMDAIEELDGCAPRLHSIERKFDKYGDRVAGQLTRAQDAMDAAKVEVRKIVDVERKRDGLVAEIAASGVAELLTNEMRQSVKSTDLPEFFLPSINMFDKVEDLAAAGTATASIGHYQGERFFLKKYPVIRLEAFKREAKQLRKCSHAQVIVPLGYIEDTHFLCLALPFYENGSLQQHIADTSLNTAQRREIYRDILLALEHVHSRNLVHCDVKPHNILLSDGWRGVLADFDVSHEDRTITMREKTTKGGYTVGYAPPEVMDGEKATPAADIYSLGVTIREVEAERMCADLDALMIEMMSEDPDTRPTATQCLKRSVFSVNRV